MLLTLTRERTRPPGWRIARPFSTASNATALSCSLVAVIMGVVWSLAVPPLQAHDEPAHVYYAQFLAETGQTPRPIATGAFSPEETAVINGLRLFDVAGNTDAKPPWTEAQESALRAVLQRGLPQVGQGGDAGVGSYPPLYYALGALVYRLTPGSLLDRVWSMRLVSAVLAGVSALFLFLFVRTTFPGKPWLWPCLTFTGTFVPIFGFMSGVFNPDIGVTAASCAVFFLLARSFRRGVSTSDAALIALAVGTGILAKLSMFGLMPGVLLGVAILSKRQRSAGPLFVFVIALAVELLAYAAVNALVWNRPALFGSGGGVAGQGVSAGNWREMLVYVWQDYLPRLPFMKDLFPDFPPWDRWFSDWVGRFGWGDYGLPRGAAVAAAACLGAVVLVGVGSLLLHGRRVVRSAAGEIASYACMSGGLLFLLAYTGYGYTKTTGYGFEQSRYLLPLLPVYAALIGNGLATLRRDAGLVVGTVVVVGSVCFSFWGLVLTVGRFYG